MGFVYFSLCGLAAFLPVHPLWDFSVSFCKRLARSWDARMDGKLGFRFTSTATWVNSAGSPDGSSWFQSLLQASCFLGGAGPSE